MTQADVAEQVGVTQQQVSDWERDRGVPHRHHSRALSTALGVPPLTVGLATLDVDPARAAELAAIVDLVESDATARRAVTDLVSVRLEARRRSDRRPGVPRPAT